jgi:hypothetical protein
LQKLEYEHEKYIFPLFIMKTMTNSNKTELKPQKPTKIEHEQQEEIWNFNLEHEIP